MEVKIVFPDEEAMCLGATCLQRNAIEDGDVDLLEMVSDSMLDFAMTRGISRETETMLGFARLDARAALQAFYDGTDLFDVVQ